MSYVRGFGQVAPGSTQVTNPYGLTTSGFTVGTPTISQVDQAAAQYEAGLQNFLAGLPVNSPAEASEDQSYLYAATGGMIGSQGSLQTPSPSSPAAGSLNINPWLIIAAVGILAFAVAK